MYAISSYRGNRHRSPARPLSQTHRQDRLQYTSAQCIHCDLSVASSLTDYAAGAPYSCIEVTQKFHPQMTLWAMIFLNKKGRSREKNQKRGAKEGGLPGGTLQGRHLKGEDLEFLAFALQGTSVGLYLFLIYSVHWGRVLRVGRAAPRTFAPGGNNPRDQWRRNRAVQWTGAPELLGPPSSGATEIFLGKTLWKIIKIVATRWRILRLKCTKFRPRWGA